MRRLALVARRVEGLSGAARIILEEARAAAAAGWQAHVFAEDIAADEVRAAGAIPRRLPGWPWGSYLKRRFFAALAGRAARGFDLVHGHGDLLDQDVLSLHNCVHAAYQATRGAPLPSGDAVGRMHALQLSARRFRALVANSRLMRDDVMRRFGVPAESIEVIYPGCDFARFHAADRARLAPETRAELGIKSGELLFGLVTSGDFAKRGLSIFLEAFAEVTRTFPSARALIVGKEARPAAYLRRAAELGVAERVAFHAPSARVERFYHALDVYVHAARWEEFGMTVLEAMACGVPVLVGAKVGAAELLSGEARGLVLPEISAPALAASMNRLAREPALRARLSEAGPAAAASCSWAAHGRALLALYERLMK